MSNQGDINSFFSAPDAYDDFMGRFSRPLAETFVKSINLSTGDRVLDLGCGPGALTAQLVPLVGVESVSVVDPSPPFLEACVAAFPGITGKVGRAEELPFANDSFDAVMSQLVIHFFSDLGLAGREIVRVTRPGGQVSVCTWIMNQMDLFTLLDRSALAAMEKPAPAVRPRKLDEDGAIGRYLESIGLVDISETTISVEAAYIDFEDLWRTYLGGVGPMGPWLVQQSDEVKMRVREHLSTFLDEPEGGFTLCGVARAGSGTLPG